MMRWLWSLLSCLLLYVAFPLPAFGYVVVIDPGHGGKDAGALGSNSKEKDVVLAVGRQVKELLEKNMKDVDVVMTRDTDRFIPLQGRADLANSKKADIFISIHANSIDLNSKNRNTVSGASVYTLGLKRTDANLAVAMRENSVMKLEKDYKTTYSGFDPNSTESYIMFEMLQQHNLESSISLAGAIEDELVATASRKRGGVKQAPFWVLVQTSMPAVLVELDFICNPEQEEFMTSEKGQKLLARAIYEGVDAYRHKHKSSPPQEKKTQAKENKKAKEKKQEEPTEKENNTEPILFRIQFLTSPRAIDKKDPRLKGIKKVDSYKEKNTYKYVSGSYSTLEQAQKDLPKLKERYPDAFIVKTRGGERVR